MAKEILFGNEARLRIKAGIDKAAAAVAPTLGAVGMSAIIEFPGLDPIEADDGVTILKNLEFKDHYENLGLQKLRKAAIRTSIEGGDGTATTTVIAQALVSEAFKEIANDSSKIREVREKLQKGLTEVLSELSKIKRDITEDDIEKIATISSLDPEVAKVIAGIIKEVGINGVVTVEKGPQIGYTSEIVKGARFDRGFISSYFINQPETQSVVLNDPYIILVDRVVSTNEQVMSLIQSIGTGKDILFIADDVTSVALATLAVNAQNKVCNVACIKNPYSASRGRDFLDDMAALTGATVISEQRGMRLDEQTKDVCGRSEKVIVTKDTTTIIGGKGDVSERVSLIEADMLNTVSEYAKAMLEERLAQLTGGIGVIRVGTYTDTEFNAKKYKFDNAINATQASLQEGIIAGGGIALWKLVNGTSYNGTKITEPIFLKALSAPIKQMAMNAGMDWTEVSIGLTSEPEDTTGSPWFDIGYDFKSKKLVNMFDAGIIDPFKVVRLALESAVAITSSLVSIETAITISDEPKDTK